MLTGAGFDCFGKERMSHFGVLSYKGTGHLNPLVALSRQFCADLNSKAQWIEDATEWQLHIAKKLHLWRSLFGNLNRC
jgi:hypothetical protein